MENELFEQIKAASEENRELIILKKRRGGLSIGMMECEHKYIAGVDPAGEGKSRGAVMINRVIDGEMIVEYIHITRDGFEEEVRRMAKHYKTARMVERNRLFINQSRLTRQFNSGEYQRSERLQNKNKVYTEKMLWMRKWANVISKKYAKT